VVKPKSADKYVGWSNNAVFTLFNYNHAKQELVVSGDVNPALGPILSTVLAGYVVRCLWS